MFQCFPFAPGAEANGLACMLADLLRQNLESKPSKLKDFFRMHGDVGIVAEDADIALTLRFRQGTLTLFEGLIGVPDLTVRGSADVIMSLSNLPLFLGLPLPSPRDRASVAPFREMVRAMVRGDLHSYGMATSPRLFLQVTRVMSVND
jgi:hypothetical protein